MSKKKPSAKNTRVRNGKRIPAEPPKPVIAHDVAEWTVNRLTVLNNELRRFEKRLADLKDERKKTTSEIRATQAEMRSVIQDGPDLFAEKGADEGPTGAGKAGPAATSKSAQADAQASPPKSTSPSTTAKSDEKPTTTQAPSKSQASQDTEPGPSQTGVDVLAGVTVESMLGNGCGTSVESLKKAGIVTLRDAFGKGKKYIARNGNLDESAVQLIFDRIHFLRTGEVREPALAGAA